MNCSHYSPGRSISTLASLEVGQLSPQVVVHHIPEVVFNQDTVGESHKHRKETCLALQPDWQDLKRPGSLDNFFFFFFFWLCWVFIATRGLFSSCGEQGLLFVAVRRLLIAVASLVAEHGL